MSDSKYLDFQNNTSPMLSETCFSLGILLDFHLKPLWSLHSFPSFLQGSGFQA